MEDGIPKHDILILGGGPSGLSTALHLARDFPHLASRILILEKAHYPRLKLCAGGLVADAEVILERLGLDVSEIPHVNVDTAHFDFAGKGLSLRMPKRHAIRVIRRNEFDAWLAEKTKEKGMKIREGARSAWAWQRRCPEPVEGKTLRGRLLSTDGITDRFARI